jgi:hypothetical protein
LNSGGVLIRREGLIHESILLRGFSKASLGIWNLRFDFKNIHDTTNGIAFGLPTKLRFENKKG